jgi:hypothetical protein
MDTQYDVLVIGGGPGGTPAVLSTGSVPSMLPIRGVEQIVKAFLISITYPTNW